MLSHFSHVCLFVTPWTIATRLLCTWDSPGKNTGVDCHPSSRESSRRRDPVSLKSPALTGGFFTTSTLYYDYISFLVKFPLSWELSIALARGLGAVLVCLSFCSLIIERVSVCKMSLTRLRQGKKPTSSTAHPRFPPPGCSLAVLRHLSFSIILRNPFASLRCQSPLLDPCLLLP